MSGWGFAYGAGKGLYDVADTRIKDRLEQQREKRAQEADMELERYRAGLRREEAATQRTYLGQEAEKQRAHELSLQELKGQQAVQLQKTKDKTGTSGKKRFEIIESTHPVTGATSYLKHDTFTGDVEPYTPPGGTRADPEAINSQWSDYASAKLGVWATEKERRAVQKEMGLPDKPDGDSYSREELEYHFKQQHGGYMTGAPVPQKPGAEKPISAKTEPISAKPTEISDKDRDAAAKARRDPNLMASFMRERGASEDEIAATAKQRFPAWTKEGGKWVESGTAEPTGQALKARKPEAQAAIGARQNEARAWARGLTEASARKEFGSGPALNKYLRESGYLEHLTRKQKDKVFMIMRRLMKNGG